jgi:hypothetical protein
VVGRHLDVPAVPVPREAALEHFGWPAGPLGADSPASGALTRQQLGWEPTGPGLLDDLDRGHYFAFPAGRSAAS